jgi:hypothetical protein
VIPTILIVVGASGVTLLLAEQIYKAKLARAERSSVATQNATQKRQQGIAKHTQEATEDKPQSL